MLLWDAEAVPLVGVVGACERVYAPAAVIAVEAAIAGNEAELGAPLTGGQAPAVRAITHIRAAHGAVVGVAGAGKTTALAFVRDAFEAAGRRVVGAPTSGQAARTFEREAGVDSRTLASLLWCVDHDRESLQASTVVIVDEAAMATDRDVLRVLVAAERARAKVVLVGDDRQFGPVGPVGPGSTFTGLLDRAHRAVQVLDENVRQYHPAERRTLEHLRAGDLDEAVARSLIPDDHRQRRRQAHRGPQCVHPRGAGGDEAGTPGAGRAPRHRVTVRGGCGRCSP